jgi:enoyl-CoA hydratase/carnithine racemase
MNAVTVALGRELERAIDELGNHPDINVIVVRGAGGNFCAGGDFAEVQRLTAAGADELRTLFNAFRGACDAIGRVDIPVVAAVEGVAMAGGFELMLAADIVLVSDDARIADNHVNHRMIPGGGGSQRLPRLVGRQNALGLLLSGEQLSGVEAVRYGLAYRSLPAATFDDGVQRFVAGIAGRSRSAVIAIKRLVYTSYRKPLADGLDEETAMVVEHICDPVMSIVTRTRARS